MRLNRAAELTAPDKKYGKWTFNLLIIINIIHREG